MAKRHGGQKIAGYKLGTFYTASNPREKKALKGLVPRTNTVYKRDTFMRTGKVTNKAPSRGYRNAHRVGGAASLVSLAGAGATIAAAGTGHNDMAIKLAAGTIGTSLASHGALGVRDKYARKATGRRRSAILGFKDTRNKGITNGGFKPGTNKLYYTRRVKGKTQRVRKGRR